IALNGYRIIVDDSQCPDLIFSLDAVHKEVDRHPMKLTRNPGSNKLEASFRDWVLPYQGFVLHWYPKKTSTKKTPVVSLKSTPGLAVERSTYAGRRRPFAQ